jgi:hypothetical protein
MNINVTLWNLVTTDTGGYAFENLTLNYWKMY